MLWQPEDDPTVVLQYSVTTGWESKIRETADRLSGEFDDVQVLIYFSPKVIGPAADTVVEAVRRKHRIFVQVRDQSWFLDRLNETAATEAAAERLTTLVVEPLLASRGVTAPQAIALDDEEAAAAVLYLAFQLEDDSIEKGLTKSCFEGLVRAALRGTDPTKRLARNEVHRRILKVVPSGSPDEVIVQVDSALARLVRRSIRHHETVDEFCLSYAERERLNEKLISFELVESQLRDALLERLVAICTELEITIPDDPSEIVDRARKVLELALLERGETFVRALQSGDVGIYTLDELLDAVVADVGKSGGDLSGLGGNAVPVIAAAVHRTLTYPTPEVLRYLQLFARSYTLFSLAKATPNVQRAIVKMFSGGEIWIDTTAVLPLFAETLIDEEYRRFTSLLVAAREAGVRFFVTPGVLEEIERHMNRCRAYMMARSWDGPVPFLAAAFELAGGQSNQLGSWLENFRGSSRPEEDIAEFLADEFGISVVSLSEDAEAIEDNLRFAVKEIWSQVQDRRRARSSSRLDPITAMKLAEHDAENYLGVIHRRKAERASPFGYTTWWLTLDRFAYKVRAELRGRLAGEPPPSPVLSPDFLAHYLSIGPIRQYLKSGSEVALPLMLDAGAMDLVSSDLMELAGKVRADCEGLPPRVIRRRIRDALDAQRLREGSIAKQGLGVVEDWMASD